MATVKDASGNLPMSLDNATKVDRHIAGEGYVHRSFPVTASDSLDIPQGVTNFIMVTTAGAYKVSYADGSTDTINLIAGVWHPSNIRRVWSTGAASTAGIVAGY